MINTINHTVVIGVMCANLAFVNRGPTLRRCSRCGFVICDLRSLHLEQAILVCVTVPSVCMLPYIPWLMCNIYVYTHICIHMYVYMYIYIYIESEIPWNLQMLLYIAMILGFPISIIYHKVIEVFIGLNKHIDRRIPSAADISPLIIYVYNIPTVINHRIDRRRYIIICLKWYPH